MHGIQKLAWLVRWNWRGADTASEGLHWRVLHSKPAPHLCLCQIRLRNAGGHHEMPERSALPLRARTVTVLCLRAQSTAIQCSLLATASASIPYPAVRPLGTLWTQRWAARYSIKASEAKAGVPSFRCRPTCAQLQRFAASGPSRPWCWVRPSTPACAVRPPLSCAPLHVNP